jgi:hypothetical protein
MLHAKDDCPEVRREVFKLLAGFPLKFYAVVRDKRFITDRVLAHSVKFPKYRYRPNDLYDNTVGRLFEGRLSRADAIQACFATRGSADRTTALKTAIENAKRKFRDVAPKRDKTIPIEVTACESKVSPALQAADYFMWATQRAFVKGECRFLDTLSPSIAIIHDVDDLRTSEMGEHYTPIFPLTAQKIKAPPGI